MPLIVKRKATGFFRVEDIATIKQACQDVTLIISEASLLIRTYYLEWFESEITKKGDYGNDPLVITKDLLELCCSIVQGITSPPYRGANKSDKEKLDQFHALVNCYKRLYNDKPNHIISKYSLSHILAYSIDNLLTAYNNNIEQHFVKYPKRFIWCDLVQNGYDAKEAKQFANNITNHIMYDIPVHEDVLEESIDLMVYKELFPNKTKEEKNHGYNMAINPWLYLFKMVSINRCLEIGFPELNTKMTKLFNPLPMHSSFIPMHIRLDTSGLVQLLMTKELITDFKDDYWFEHKVHLQVSNKADMLSSFEKIFGRKPRDDKEGADFATSIWYYLTHLKTCRQSKELQQQRKNGKSYTFDNAVITDGISISFQIIETENAGRKTFNNPKKTKKTESKVTNEFINVADYDKCYEHKKMISDDPGKKDIGMFTDGFNTVRYTKAQRDQDTLLHARQKATLKLRKKQKIENYETTILNQTPKNTCFAKNFQQYCNARKEFASQFLEVYGHPMFRQHKFLVYTKVKSSEMKCMNAIVEKFKDPVNLDSPKIQSKHCTDYHMKLNAIKECRGPNDFIIAWGNWGRNPNIKNNAPSPGIGIRRRFHSFFETITVPENGTSQGCPCCKTEKSLKKVTINNIERHHLLRCTNDNCESRLWNRNVAGAFNILERCFQLLPETGMWA